jgi:hypothetical protein
MTDSHAEPHTMTRIDINTGMPFDAFVSAFEEAAPAFDPLPVQRVVESSGNWDDVRAEVAKNDPNELMRYEKIDATPLLGVAEHRTRAIECLVGRHEPNAPLRMLVYSDADEHAIFAMDKPSSAFGSLGIAAVTAVGEDLDRKVANLLRIVGVDADRAFA